MATEPFFQIQKSFCHGFTSVTKSFTVRSTVLEGQNMLHATTICAVAKGPTIGPLATRRNGGWLLYFERFFPPKPVFIGGLHPQARNHRATPQGACFHRSHCRPEQSSDHLPSGMLMRCTCTVPWTTSSTSKTFCDQTKRSTSNECARFEFHIMHLATTRNVQRDWLSTDTSPIAPFPKQHLRHRPYLGVSGAGREAARRTC